MKGISKKIFRLSVLGLITAFSASANAAGYKLEFQSPSVLADAGDAAVVNDASTNWYNSAGLVYLPQQFVGSVIDVYQRTVFKGTSNAAVPLPFGVPGSPFNYVNTNSSASSYPNAILPAMHYVYPFKDRYAFGISVVPAWGLMEDYGESSDVRYNLNKISTKTIDVAPSLAMRVNDQWSVGAGPDIHYFSLQSRVHVRTQFPVAFGGTTTDSISRYNANNWGRGFHAGVLYRITEATRIGLNYRSKIVMNMTGGSDFTLSGITQFHTDQFKVSIPLPPTTSLSIYHDISPIWAVMGTIAYDQWNVIQYYYGQNIITPPAPPATAGVKVSAVLPQNFNNTIDLSVGTHYKLNDKVMLRGSLKYEPTPTVNSSRALSFPDADKLGVNLGAHYTYNKKFGFDFIYAHVFTKQVHINDVNPVTGATSVGHTNTSIDLLGAQVVWNI